MSLNPLQMHNTKKELRKNFEITRLSKSEVATDLKISEVKLEKIEKTGQQPVPFTALSGDWHRHWFLNSNLIDQQQMSKGDN